MPSVKIKKHAPENDMTPFVDVAFLILSFFMLATKFKPEEPVEVTTPNSVSSQALPEKDAFMVSIDKGGRVFVSMDNPQSRQLLIENLNQTRNLGLGPAEIKNFINAPSVGVPFSQLKGLLSLDQEEQSTKDLFKKQPGIPCSDTTGGELYYWIRDALVAYSGKKLNLLIKADNNAKYPDFKNVLNAFKKNDQNKFLLVTAPEDAPAGSALYVTRQKQIQSGK
ncbi:MAG: biopolymer transporter ExbD [Chitinophagia bacterium]|jgi:biopolymer transport protein ExbD|nr:biopolymer transporter ExbD [Chitinophagia bacterium]